MASACKHPNLMLDDGLTQNRLSGRMENNKKRQPIF